ncbi:hypothetical protein ACTMU2_15895 [Cupriavidus basilensis]
MKVRFELPPLSNVLATGGGLVFTGDMVGNLYAFDADNGKELWKFNAGSVRAAAWLAMRSTASNTLRFQPAWARMHPAS